jgi:PTH1 family peptidyl-tRNA hydrolase
MAFVVGLGNPGGEYQGTRHNVGYEVVDKIAEMHHFSTEKEFRGALVSRGRVGGQEVMLVKPTTYMNLSGDAVGAIVRFYKQEDAEVIVAHDELDFEPGQVRVKIGGGHGGHKGLRSILSHLDRDFIRVRVGIGKPKSSMEGADWVLSRFDGTTRGEIDDAIDAASRAIELILEQGVQKAMNVFNRRPQEEKEEKEEEDDVVSPSDE